MSPETAGYLVTLAALGVVMLGACFYMVAEVSKPEPRPRATGLFIAVCSGCTIAVAAGVITRLLW